MKIAIASKEKKPESDISDMAGRAPYYLIFDGDGKLLKTIKNPFSIGGGGAGWGVAKMLADEGINVVIAGRFGQNMIQALKERGISYRESGGSVKDAVKGFPKNG